MSDWVRFHRELRQGDKRGLSRATRFVYMELSQEARARRGFIVMPAGMSDVDAIHDILGGNRREVVEAVKALSVGADPMVSFEDRQDGKRVCVVLKWETWNPTDPTAADRQRRHRQAVTSNGDVTRDSHGPIRDSIRDVTRIGRDASVTGTEPEEIRGEKIKIPASVACQASRARVESPGEPLPGPVQDPQAQTRAGVLSFPKPESESETRLAAKALPAFEAQHYPPLTALGGKP